MDLNSSASADSHEYLNINNQLTGLEPIIPHPSLDDYLEAAFFQDLVDMDHSELYPPPDGTSSQQLDNGTWSQTQDNTFQVQWPSVPELGYGDPFEDFSQFGSPNDLLPLSDLSMSSTSFPASSFSNFTLLAPAIESQFPPPSNFLAQESNHSSQTSHSAPTAVYKCPHCAREFVKRHQLNRHERVHTAPVACPVRSCPHRTATNRDLNRHIIARHPAHQLARSMSALPSHRCPFGDCRYARDGFKRKDHLTRHVRNVHAREVA